MSSISGTEYFEAVNTLEKHYYQPKILYVSTQCEIRQGSGVLTPLEHGDTVGDMLVSVDNSMVYPEVGCHAVVAGQNDDGEWAENPVGCHIKPYMADDADDVPGHNSSIR